MKKILILSISVSLLISISFTACTGDTSTPVHTGTTPLSVETEAPDDIVHTPGGDAYRANVHQEGVPDRWPSIESVFVTLDDIKVHYRQNIETQAGETRNNIISVYREEGHFVDRTNLTLYSVAVPDGMIVTDIGGGGRPGMLLTVLSIAVSIDVGVGEYTFQIGTQIDGKDYGTIPCTVSVVE